MRSYAFETLEDPRPMQGFDAQASRLQAEAEWEQARQEGFAAGREEAMRALTPASAALASAVDGLRTEVAELTDRLEAEAVELALVIAEKIVSGTLELQPERVVEVVRGALRGIADRSHVTVLVNPDDLELVREAAAGIAATLGGVEALEVQGERRVAVGGAIVRHPAGEVDATLQSKLQRVHDLAAGR